MINNKNLKIFLLLASVVICILAVLTTIFTINNLNHSLQCLYDGKTYQDGESFLSIDNCNTCSCSQCEVICTEMACIDGSTQ